MKEVGDVERRYKELKKENLSKATKYRRENLDFFKTIDATTGKRVMDVMRDKNSEINKLFKEGNEAIAKGNKAMAAMKNKKMQEKIDAFEAYWERKIK